MKSWPEEKRKAWHAAREGSYIKMYNLLNHHYYRSSHRSEERKAVLKAFLSDPGMLEHEIAHMTNLSSLMDGGVVLRDEIYEVVQALPKDNPRRAEFLTEVAGIMAWREKKVEEAMAIYEQAGQEAAERKDETTQHLNWAYRALCTSEHGEGRAAAWEYRNRSRSWSPSQLKTTFSTTPCSTNTGFAVVRVSYSESAPGRPFAVPGPQYFPH